MSERTVNPRDNADLALLLQSFGDVLGTLYPQAHVYGNDNSEISGSPFTLDHVANNLYSLNNAFQVADSGTYKVVYLVYTDAGHTTRSTTHGEVSDIINVKIQSTTGLGGYGSMKNGGDVIVDMDPIFKAIKDLDKKFNKRIDKIRKEINKEFKVSVPATPVTDLNPILDKLNNIDLGQIGVCVTDISNLSKTQKDGFQKLNSSIKKNRSTTIKNAFDKSMMKPILQSVADSDLKIVRGFKDLRVDMVKIIDTKNDEANKKFNESLDSSLNKFVESLNKLNESVRKKLKFTLDGLRTLLFVGKQGKQDINITLKKDEL